ncbi:MAG: mechanosensitive ion channel domain-containing protein [Desulfobacterales bacterium]
MLLVIFYVVLAIITGLALNNLIFKILSKRLIEKETEYGIEFRRSLHSVFRILLPLFLVLLMIPSLPVSSQAGLVSSRLLTVFMILMIGFLSIKMVHLGRNLVLRRYDINTKDNLKARAIHTQMNMLVKIAVIVIVIISGASCLMIFENVRQVGTSILASAGVIGIIIGFAAQRSIAALLAGLQLAITQPIRIDDVVIVDGEWGQVEEITLTYVVVRIWDLRRLVVPTSYFLEKSFQNWTRTSADLLGTVLIYADYRLPVDAVREHLGEIVKNHELWDGKVWRLHVTNATEKAIELRALVSAANSGDAWELRCFVREKLLAFLQSNYPESLPKVRAEIIERAMID